MEKYRVTLIIPSSLQRPNSHNHTRFAGAQFGTAIIFSETSLPNHTSLVPSTMVHELVHSMDNLKFKLHADTDVNDNTNTEAETNTEANNTNANTSETNSNTEADADSDSDHETQNYYWTVHNPTFSNAIALDKKVLTKYSRTNIVEAFAEIGMAVAADVASSGKWKEKTPEWKDVENQFEIVKKVFGEYYRVDTKGCPEKRVSGGVVNK